MLSKNTFVVALVAIFAACSRKVHAEPAPWGQCVGLDSNNQTVCDYSGTLPDIPGYTKPIDATQRGQPRAAWDVNQYFSWIQYYGSSELSLFKCEELCPGKTTTRYRGFLYKWFNSNLVSNYCMCHYDPGYVSNFCYVYSKTGYFVSCNNACTACEGIQYLNGFYAESFYSYDAKPSSQPSISIQPSTSLKPSTAPSNKPSTNPSSEPSSLPSSKPSLNPSSQPSSTPSDIPSKSPSSSPSSLPSIVPSDNPSRSPSSVPSAIPSENPSSAPSESPSESLPPSGAPSCTPSQAPTPAPSINLFYPNFDADDVSQGCLNDGNQPAYMNSATELYMHSRPTFPGITMDAWVRLMPHVPVPFGIPTGRELIRGVTAEHPSVYFFSTKSDCCNEYYSWNLAECMGSAGSTSGDKFYPDWLGDDTCKNDGAAPTYMALDPAMWLHDTLSECCAKNYSWKTKECMGSSTSSGLYYPDWSGHNEGCLADGNEPQYMVSNPSSWLFSSLLECCETHYPYNLSGCIQDAPSVGTGKFYMHWIDQKCVQDCTGDAPCGGLAKSWDAKYDTKAECCKEKTG